MRTPMLTDKAVALTLVLAIFALSIACAPGGSTGGTELPGGPVAVSEEAARRLEERVNQAFQGSQNGEFNLRATDEEVTSWVAYRVANQPDAQITAPQIRFTQGKAFAAVTLVGVLPVRLRTTMVTSVNVVDGRIQVNIEKTSAGPLPLPKALLQAVSKTVNETLMESQMDLAVTGVEILESEIRLTGRIS